MTKESLTGGEIVVRCLEQMGADYIFGMCGHTGAAILSALEDSKIEFISTRHESIASHAADCYFKASHKPALVLTHIGPGLTNAITGVAHAALDCTPMLVIAGEVPTYRHGQESFQELSMHTDASQHEIYRPFVKRAWRVDRIDLLPYVMTRAFNTAVSGRSGPVLISIPMDLLSAKADVEIPDLWEHMATGCRGKRRCSPNCQSRRIVGTGRETGHFRWGRHAVIRGQPSPNRACPLSEHTGDDQRHGQRGF